MAASFIVWRQMPPQSAPRIQPTGAVPSVAPDAPEPAWLLAQRDELKINAAQFQKLSRLRVRWERDTRDLHDALRRASAAFNRDMAQSNGKTVTMQQLQERAAPVSEISRQLTEARRAWWSEAGQALTVTQRQQAEGSWARRFARP